MGLSPDLCWMSLSVLSNKAYPGSETWVEMNMDWIIVCLNRSFSWDSCFVCRERAVTYCIKSLHCLSSFYSNKFLKWHIWKYIFDDVQLGAVFSPIQKILYHSTEKLELIYSVYECFCAATDWLYTSNMKYLFCVVISTRYSKQSIIT